LAAVDAPYFSQARPLIPNLVARDGTARLVVRNRVFLARQKFNIPRKYEFQEFHYGLDAAKMPMLGPCRGPDIPADRHLVAEDALQPIHSRGHERGKKHNAHALDRRITLGEHAIAVKGEPGRHDHLIEPPDSIDREQIVDVPDENVLGQIDAPAWSAVAPNIIFRTIEK